MEALRLSAELPTISLVTATWNRAGFLEAAMRSVLDQAYPKLEYVVVDGGSTDGSVEIIRKYADRLAWWCSEKDSGHCEALNKGFARTAGEVMGWLNSDDMLTPWALAVVGEIFATFPQVQWITTLFPLLWDAQGRARHCRKADGYSKSAFLRGEYLPRPGSLNAGWIQQESTFWRRSLWDKAGGKVTANGRMTHDFELWARFYDHADLYGVTTPIGGFRLHGEQVTAKKMDEILAAGMEVLKQHGGKPYGPMTTRLLKSKLGRYLPATVKGMMGARHRKKVITHAGALGGWKIAEE